MPRARLLIVEDERVVALDIKSILKRLGYQVMDTVSSGEDALKKVEKNRPDLVLMDVKLDGEIDGVKAAQKIRSLYEVPVIFLTAYADPKTINRAKETFPYGYIVKPFEEKEIMSTIEIALSKHSIEKEIKEETENAIAAILGTVELMLEEADEKLDQETIDKINLITNAANIIKQSIEKL